MSLSEQDFVENNEILLRRCPNMPTDFVNPVDFVTKRPKLGRAGVRLKEGDDGLSVHREGLLVRNGQDKSAVSKNCSCYVFAFAAYVVRIPPKWDALFDPHNDDEIGHAHTLIAPTRGFKYSRAMKEEFNIVRSHIIDAAVAVFIPTAA